MDGHTYDILLSHSWDDNDVTDRLRTAFERAGAAVWYDRENQRDFESITRAITEGLARSRGFVAFYSHDYPKSRACQHELTAAFISASHEGDPRRRLMVINPEKGFGHILPVELRDALIPTVEDWSDEAALDEVAQRVLQHIDGISSSFGDIVSLAPPRWIGIQPLSAPRFVGRMSQMWEIHSALHAPDYTPVTGRGGPGIAALVGLAGVGKTLLAEEYALRFGAAFPGGVVWLHAGGGRPKGSSTGDENARRLRDQLLELARALYPGEALDVLATSELRALLGATMDARGDRSLWIVDELPPELAADEFRGWLPPSHLARGLFTTRSAEYGGIAEQVPVGVLHEDEGLVLLTSRREPTSEEERTAASEIVRILGEHALAVDVAGAALASFAGLRSYADFHRSLLADDEDALELAAELAAELPTGHEKSIAKTLLDSIRDLQPSALDYLRVASVLSTAPISAALVAAILGAADHPDGDPDQVGVARALRDLDRHSLAQPVEEPEGARTVHPLVSRVVAFADSDPERREYLRQATVHVLTETLAAHKWRAGDVHANNALAHARWLIADPDDLLTATLMGVVGRIDLDQGEPDVALSIFERQQEAIIALGAGLEAELALATNIGGALHQLGRLAEAQALYATSLERARRELPESAEAITALLHGQAATLRDSGDFGAARDLQEETYRRISRMEGAESRRAVTELSNLAGTVEAQGHLEEALEIQERVLALRQRDLGEEDALTLNTLNNISILYRKLARPNEARPIAEHVLEARRRLLGEDHPDTIIAMGNLANQHSYEGRYEEALELEQEALEHWRARRGEHHPSALILATNLADTLSSVDRVDEAIEIQARAAVLASETYGAHHPLALRTAANHAALLRQVGDLAAAAERQTSLITGYESAFGHDHLETLVLRGNFAITLFSLERLEEARVVQEEVLADWTRRYPEDHPGAIVAKTNLALTLNRLDDRPRAITLLEQAVASQRRTLPATHPDRARVLAPLATMLALEGEVERAAELAAEERRLHLTGPIDERTLREETLAWALHVAEKGRKKLMPKPGRNDPCWCGSGKKFKRCHGA